MTPNIPEYDRPTRRSLGRGSSCLERNLQVLKLLSRGLTNTEFGRKLSNSVHLVRQDAVFSVDSLRGRGRLVAAVNAQKVARHRAPFVPCRLNARFRCSAALILDDGRRGFSCSRAGSQLSPTRPTLPMILADGVQYFVVARRVCPQ